MRKLKSLLTSMQPLNLKGLNLAPCGTLSSVPNNQGTESNSITRKVALLAGMARYQNNVVSHEKKAYMYIHLLKYIKPIIGNLVNCIIGNGTFRGHLNRLQLAAETCCLYCGASEKTFISCSAALGST